MKGRVEVGRYFGNYASVHDWHLQCGLVDRRPAIIATDPTDSTRHPAYFILLYWTTDRISAIRDFRHAHYVIEAAEIAILD
jgi:RNA polymerase sigma-70 factor (ECF subfamily)